jgi:hypothetical protein
VDTSPKKLRAAQVVARLDGTTIRGSDVVAFHAGSDEQSLDRSSYDALVKHAVERQLTFEAARKQGVTLSDAEQAQLAEVRKQAVARGSTVPPFTPTPDEIELEVRDAEASLLQTDLLARAGTPPPASVDQQPAWTAKRQALLDQLQSEATIRY